MYRVVLPLFCSVCLQTVTIFLLKTKSYVPVSCPVCYLFTHTHTHSLQHYTRLYRGLGKAAHFASYYQLIISVSLSTSGCSVFPSYTMKTERTVNCYNERWSETCLLYPGIISSSHLSNLQLCRASSSYSTNLLR